MVGKVFSILVVAVAVLLAALYVVLPTERLQDIVYFVRFFDVMIPVLAVGALIKYICCCNKNSKCDN